LLELADAQRWWWQRRDLFGRERECGLQLRHCLLKLRGCGHVSACVPRPSAGWQYLLDVGLSLRAMPCLGFCITTALWAVAAGGRAIGSCLGHVVRQGGNGGGVRRW
jgi:hypothetical protein